jgi:general stress protein 26
VFSDIRKQHYVSLTGRAELSDDRAKIKQLWSSLDSAFWSDEDDPSIRVLKITPIIVEYWDRAGAVASAVKMVKAALAGSQPELRSNEKVELT